ncbi:hypothetical protein BJY21_000022 [Kineosphaera limosa]|uniref:DUF222 domain-containing protein n=1 Tax=Kineosphaera limosa NBRC 100340 TaxID=1184609 RepID=K6W6N7_9MICO|nr:HNH endonuclease signature motif containing protein [Kineosphaera limosa]NYD98837.1 hypothetical protein [Kineosphaera limosa]GAB94840.1 hypothetical protein KILIM_012_00240 [Kineosphaera limosa NBRC 100340]
MADSMPPTTDRSRQGSEGAPVLFAELPSWFGPGNEAPGRLFDLSVRELVQLVAESERLITWLRYVQLAATDRMVDGVLEAQGREPEELNGRGSDPDVRKLVESLVAEETSLASGVPSWESEARADFVTAAPEATRRLNEAMRDGECTWERARKVRERTKEQASCVADEVARRVLAPPRRGEVVSWSLFTRRLGRALSACADSERQRARARRERDAFGRFTEHGMGSYTITGSAERVGAAHQRVDSLARRLRSGGDKRTLAQLRSDIALDLVIGGQPGRCEGPPQPVQAAQNGVALSAVAAKNGLASNGVAAQVCGCPVPCTDVGAGLCTRTLSSVFAGAVPAGRINVTISLASLVGVTDDPGQTPRGLLPADLVRDVACAEGTTLARIVTDPHDGQVIEASTDRYRPTAAMRRFVTARYGTCVAPGCTQPAATCELDHGIPWPLGATTTRNVTPKGGRHHEYKTRGWWRADQDGATGVVTWETFGGTYRSYPVRYGHDPDTAGEQGPDDATARRIVAYRQHIEHCRATDPEMERDLAHSLGRTTIPQGGTRQPFGDTRHVAEPGVGHDDCAGAAAWLDPSLPGESCGVAARPTTQERVDDLRIEKLLKRVCSPPTTPGGGGESTDELPAYARRAYGQFPRHSTWGIDQATSAATSRSRVGRPEQRPRAAGREPCGDPAAATTRPPAASPDYDTPPF